MLSSERSTSKDMNGVVVGGLKKILQTIPANQSGGADEKCSLAGLHIESLADD